MKLRNALLVAALGVCAGQARADEDQAPPYDKGHVWVYTDIKTKPGHFDEYLRYLDTDFKRQSEARIKAGRMLGYKIFVIDSPRKDEPDVTIAREYENMAAFDRTTADEYALDKQINGSVAKQEQAYDARGAIREVLGITTAREVILK